MRRRLTATLFTLSISASLTMTAHAAPKGTSIGPEPFGDVFDPFGGTVFDPWGPPVFDPPPKDPGLAPPPAPPAAFIGLRGADSLQVRIFESASDETYHRIERYDAVLGWIAVAFFGPIDGYAAASDSGLSSDARYCYRAVAGNNFGESASPPACGWTRDGTSRAVTRLQLRVRTGGLANADTEDAVWVALNSGNDADGPSGNLTWLDYGIDDFEANEVHTYDLGLAGVGEIGDITALQLGKEGDDQWCLAEVALLVNGTELLTREFSAEPGGCRWMANQSKAGGLLSIEHDELRAEPSWWSGAIPLPVMGAAELRSRIEGTVGNLIHGTDLYWQLGPTNPGGLFVDTWTLDASTLHVDLELAAAIEDYWNPIVDIDFDLEVAGGCDGAGTLSLELTPTNVVIDSESSLAQLVTESDVEAAIADAWNVEPIQVEVAGVSICDGGATLQYFFSGEGDLLLG